jgi:glucokinase
MSEGHYPRLLGDVGGTNARFAWQDAPGAPLSHVASSLCNDHDSLIDAIRHHLQVHALPQPRACGIGIANPIVGDRVQMTNHHWSFSIQELKQALGVERLVVLNDFAATALSLPGLAPGQLRHIGGGQAIEGAPIAVLGPGTGLGVSGLLRSASGHLVALDGEGGHATLPAFDAAEAAVIDVLRQRFEHVSAERVLSGPGLVNLYEAMATLRGDTVRTLAPSDVIERARHHDDASCKAALAHFCAFLGTVAGNLALTLGARGGVYLAGGIAPRITGELESSLFRQRFESKGRFASYLSRIPTFVIASDVSPAFIGASRALDDGA